MGNLTPELLVSEALLTAQRIESLLRGGRTADALSLTTALREDLEVLDAFHHRQLTIDWYGEVSVRQ